MLDMEIRKVMHDPGRLGLNVYAFGEICPLKVV